MAVDKFIPEVWAQEIEMNIQQALVGMNFVNTNYEGEISGRGDKLHIVGPGAIATKKYTGADITFDDVSDAESVLEITESDYFAFKIPDIAKAQANPKMITAYSQEASYSLQVSADVFIFGMYADALAGNVITVASLDKDNIYSTLVDAEKRLNAQGIPLAGRKAALSPDEIALLELSGVINRAGQIGDKVVQDGAYGVKVAGFDIFVSSNLHEDDPADIAVGDPVYRYLVYNHPMSTTFAAQINSVEAVRLEANFADGVKGLHTYGKKTIKNAALGCIKVKIGVGTKV